MTDPKKAPKKSDSGYNNQTIANVKDYLQKYYQSDFFKKNIEKGQAGWKLGKGGEPNQKAMSDAVKNTLVQIINSGASQNDRSGNAIISTTQLPNEDPGLVSAHELAHSNEDVALNAQPRNVHLMLSQNKAYRKLDNWVRVAKQERINQAKKDLYNAGLENLNIANSKGNEYGYDAYQQGFNPVKDKIEQINRDFSIKSKDWYHDDAPNEIRADILGLRYLAQKNKIWDPVSNPGEKLDEEKYNKIMNMKELNNKGESEIKQRLKLRFNDDTIKYFLKNIAANKSKAPGLYNDNNV